MDISQKKFSNKTKFEFEDESLKFTVKDKSGSQSFTVDYGSIPKDSGELEERNLWYRNVGGIWVLLGAFFIVSRYFETGEFRNSIWLVIGLICLITYWVAKTAYTVIDTEKGRLYIIKNKQHDEIISEIDARRKGQWLSWYGSLNLENNPEREINKFKWLLNEEVITKEEFNEKEKAIINHHNIEISTAESDSPHATIN